MKHKDNPDIIKKDNYSKGLKKESSPDKINQFILWVFCIILAMTPLFLVPALQNSAILPKYIFSIAGLSVAIALWCLEKGTSGKMKIIPMGMGIPFLLFGICWLIPSLFRSNRLISLYEGLPMLFWLAGAFILSHHAGNKKNMNYLVGAIIIGGSLCALYALMQYMNLDVFQLKWLGRKMIGKQIMISTFGNANFFAAYLVPIFLLVLTWMVLSPVQAKWRILGIILLIIMAACILLSGVRSAWISLPVSLLAGGVLLISRRMKQQANPSGPRSPKQIIKWSMVALILLITFAGVMHKYQVYKTDWLKTRIQTLSNIHELEERFLIWQVTMQMIRDNPLRGIGIGKFQADFFPQLSQFLNLQSPHGEYNAVLIFIGGKNANHSHNDILQMTAESGIPAIAVFFWILVFFSYFQIKAIRHSDHWDWKIRQTGLFCGTLPFWVDMLVSFPLYLPANGLLFWSLTGLSIAHLYREPSREPILTEKVFNRITRISVICLGMIALLIGGWYGTTQAYAGYSMKKGLYHLQKLEAREALDSFKKTLDYNPTMGNAYILIGKLYGVSGLLEPALKSYETAAMMGTDDITVYEDPALFLYMKGDYQRAADLYQTILTLYPTHAVSHKQLGIIYTKYIPDTGKAIFHIEKYLATNPPANEKAWFQKTLEELKKTQ